MYCPKCGRQNPDNAKFCQGCGERLDAAGTGKEQSSQAKTSAGKQPKKKIKKSSGKKIGAMIAVVVVLVIILGALVGLLFFGRSEETAEVAEDGDSVEEVSGNTETYDNGDTVYIPGNEELAYDEASYTIYFDDLLVAYLCSDLDKDDAKALAATVDGTVVGDISGAVNLLQIQVEHTDLDGLNAYADILMESEDVMYAGYDFPMFIIENSSASDLWGESGRTGDSLGDEDNPGGNDWWAEAIGAYTAWDLAEAVELAEVTVGILDSGFDLEHEDLEGISMLSGYQTNSAGDHGTHVAGIIGANDNSIGVRGVADTAKLICADWSPNTNDSEDASYVNYLDTGEYIEILKQMVESGAKVINNSWCYIFMSEEGFEEDTYGILDQIQILLGNIDVTSDYNAYVQQTETSIRATAWMCILLVGQLELNGYEDFLIVQGAGNGYDNSGPGIDSYWSSFFAAIDEELYEEMAQQTYNRILQSVLTSYEDFKDHILVVGAVKNELDSDGNYFVTDFSNWGDAVDIYAPGTDIYSTLTTKDDIGDNDNDGELYGTKSGTSMAAPMVSGAAALLWQLDPDLTAVEVKALLIENSTTAIGVGDDAGTISPMLNIGMAVQAILGEDETTLMYQLYYEKLMELQDTYGEASLERMDESVIYEAGDGYMLYTYYWTGLFFAYLVDMDGDGSEELIAGYYDPDKADTSDGYSLLSTAYTIEVWTYADGEIQQAYSLVPSCIGEVGGCSAQCELARISDATYLIFEDSGGELIRYEYYGFTDGTVERIHYFDASGSAVVVDGQEYENYEDATELVLEWMNLMTDSQYWSFGEQYALQDDISYFQAQYEEEMAPAEEDLESTLAALADYLNPSSSEEEEASGLMDEDAFAEAVAGENVLYYLPADYDGDGTEEAFGITGDDVDDEGFSNNNAIYFISSSNEVTCLVSDIYGYLSTQDEFVQAGDSLFLVWELSAGGSGSVSYIFGVRDGETYEPEISQCYMIFKSYNGTYYALTSDWSEGWHDYDMLTFEYNDGTGEFVLISTEDVDWEAGIY